MLIGLVTNAFLPHVGGVEWKVHFLATEYRLAGHEVIVFRARPGRHEDGALPVVPTYSVVEAGWRPFPGYGQLGFSEWLFTRRILSYQRRSPLSVLHCHGLDLPTRYGVRAKARAGIPVVGSTFGQDILVRPEIGYGTRCRPRYDRMVRENVRRVDAVGSISRAVRRELEPMVGTTPILDIPNGVDWQAFQHGRTDWLRRRLGLPESAVLILSLGSHRPAKDFPTAVRAFASIAAECPLACYVLVGQGVTGLAPLVAELGVAGRVHLVETIPMADVPKALWSADIFFSSSVTEGFSQVVVQALACGLPCVLSDCSGNEDFAGRPFAVIGRTSDPASLGRALAELSRDSDRRRHMGVEAHAASRQYAWDVIAGQYLQAFTGIVTGARGQTARRE